MRRIWRGVLVVAIVGRLAPARGGEQPATRRGGRVEVVAHHKSEMVRVPSGQFVMGYPQEDGEHGAEDPVRAEARGLDDPARECREAVVLGDALWCSPFMLNPSASWVGHHASYLIPFLNAVPERSVFLPSFEIDRFETTVADYRVCVADGACDSGPLLLGDQRHHEQAALPITNVTWREANEYCAYRGKRLPSEAEWEKAARSTDGRAWPWGNQARADGSNHGAMESLAIRASREMNENRQTSIAEASFEVAPDASDGAEYAVPPGAMRWSESRYGVHDLSGNVSEWVADYYAPSGYGDLPVDAPVRRTPKDGDTRRAVRGGSWLDLPLAGRTWARTGASPGARVPFLGFRCARDT